MSAISKWKSHGVIPVTSPVSNIDSPAPTRNKRNTSLNRQQTLDDSNTPETIRRRTPTALMLDDDQSSEYERVAEILMRNNLNLLAALCQGTFVGETAATVAQNLIAMLRRVSDEAAEEFVKRTLRSKIIIYGIWILETSFNHISKQK